MSSLAPIVAPGTGAASQVAQGVLMGALQYFARQGGGSLTSLIGLLRDLPPEAFGGFEKGGQAGRKMSELLLAETKRNPLLGREVPSWTLARCSAPRGRARPECPSST